MIGTHSRYVIVGAGVHGLSTAWHLARELRARGLGGGEDIVVLDKRGPGAGASGIACGHRPQQLLPARDARADGAFGVGVGERPRGLLLPSGRLPADRAGGDGAGRGADLRRAAGHRLPVRAGRGDERTASRYLLGLFEDWQAPGSTIVLHEKKGGYANNIRAVRGLAAKAEAEGVRIVTGVRVTGFGHRRGRGDLGRDRPGHDRVRPARGRGRPVDPRPVGLAGACPRRSRWREPGGTGGVDRPMWTYWALQEGTLGIEPTRVHRQRGRLCRP